MYHVHDFMWKGILTTVGGMSMSAFGLAVRLLPASAVADYPTIAMASPDQSAMANFSTIVGFLTTVLGGLWTWYLLQKGKAEDARRKANEATQMTQIRLELARGIAKLELMHAEAMAATPPTPIPPTGSEAK